MNANCTGYLTALYNEQTSTITFQNHSTKTKHILLVPPDSPLNNLFSLPPNPTYTILIGVTEKSSIIQIKVPADISCNDLPVLLSNQSLPLVNVQLILPVDPMTWNSLPTDTPGTRHDALVSISVDGTISFWASDLSSDKHDGNFRCTSSVRTGRRGIRMARCSSAQKTVLGLLFTKFSLLDAE